MLKKILWSTGFIMLMVTQVNAQSVGFGPQIGYQKVRDADQGNLMGGAALRFKLSPAIGGGVELPVGATSKFTADIRYIFLDYKFEQIPGSGGVDSNSYVITAGFLFGL